MMPRLWALALVAVATASPAGGQPPGAPAPNPPAVARPAPALPNLAPDGPGRVSRPARPAAPPPAGPQRLDRHGDPLPAGALARFGSVRLRHGDGISGLGFTLDGKHLLSISSANDGFRLWDPTSGKETARLNASVQAAALAPDRTVVFVADGRVRVWEPLAAGRVRELPAPTLPDGGASALAVHPGGRVFAAAVPAGIALIDLATGERKAELRVPGDQPPLRIVFSPDGRWVAAAGPRTGVWLWNLTTLRRVRTYQSQADQIEFAFSPDGNRLVVAGGPLALFHTDSEEAVEGFTSPDNPVHAARFAADGKSLFALHQDGTLARLDAATGEAKDTWTPPEGVLPQPPLVVAANAAWVAAMDDTGGIRVWNPKDGSGPAVERRTALLDPGFSADGAAASALTTDGKVVTFDPRTGVPGKTFETGLADHGGVAWNGRAGLAVGLGKVGDDAELHVVDVAKKRVVAKVPWPTGEFPAVAFPPTESTRLGLFTAGTAAMYDTLTGQRVRAFDVGQPEVPKQGALSPDGRLVAVTTNPVSVWEVATGRKRFDLAGPADPLGVTFSPDGRRLAVADPSEVVIHDLRTGAAVRRFRSPAADPNFTAFAFAPDGSTMVTGGGDGVVTLWDVATGEALVAFDRHEGPVSGVTFSADGRRILSASFDGTALVWDATARPVAAAAAVTGVDEAFDLLVSADAAVASRGLAFLYGTPDATVRLLADKVPVPAAVPPERVARLVADLGSPEFPTRQAAIKELGDVGPEAEPALRTVAAAPPNAEVRRLAGDLLDRLAAPARRPEDLRAIRAVELLEGIGTQAARELLGRWAAGPAHHRLTTEAAAALRRLRGS